MGLRSFKLRLADRHARLVYDDGRVADVEGDALDALLVRAESLVSYVASRCEGEVRAISVIVGERVLRATYESPDGVAVLRVDGAAFDGDVEPRCRSLIAGSR